MNPIWKWRKHRRNHGPRESNSRQPACSFAAGNISERNLSGDYRRDGNIKYAAFFLFSLLSLFPFFPSSRVQGFNDPRRSERLHPSEPNGEKGGRRYSLFGKLVKFDIRRWKEKDTVARDAVASVLIAWTRRLPRARCLPSDFQDGNERCDREDGV